MKTISLSCNGSVKYVLSSPIVYSIPFFTFFSDDDDEEDNCRTVNLKSEGKKKDEKSLSKAKKITSMKLKKEKSNKKCKKDESFGFKGRKVWAKKNCEAVFKVCYEPKHNQGLLLT